MPFLKCHLHHKPLRSRRISSECERFGWHHTCFHPSGYNYVGDWDSDKPHGFGCVTYNDSYRFIGLFDKHAGYRFGTSAIKERDGKVFEIEYRGEWEHKHFNGKGVKHYRDGGVFKGTFKRSKRHGFGEMWYQNGSYYFGNWLRDQRHGLGLFVDFNGNRFEGNWCRDEKSGRGRYFHVSTGQYQDGIWDNNICVKSVMADIPFRQTSHCIAALPIGDVDLVETRNEVLLGILPKERIADWPLRSNVSAVYTH